MRGGWGLGVSEGGVMCWTKLKGMRKLSMQRLMVVAVSKRKMELIKRKEEEKARR